VSASKDKERGTWKIYLRYVDWQGIKQIHTKRVVLCQEIVQNKKRKFYYPARTSFSLD